MIKFIVLVALVAAAAFFVPPFLEGTPNVCSAFEHKIGVLVQAETAKLPPALANDPKIAAMMNALRTTTGAANGLLAEAYIHDKFPQLPPVAGCAAAYWKVTFDPDLAQYAKGKLPL
jgi:hypothetical protein